MRKVAGKASSNSSSSLGKNFIIFMEFKSVLFSFSVGSLPSRYTHYHQYACATDDFSFFLLLRLLNSTLIGPPARSASFLLLRLVLFLPVSRFQLLLVDVFWRRLLLFGLNMMSTCLYCQQQSGRGEEVTGDQLLLKVFKVYLQIYIR